MPRSLNESEYIFGLYGPGGEHLMLASGRAGWMLLSQSVGSDPTDESGTDFSAYSDRGFGVICRIDHGQAPEGTIPHSSQYDQYSRRVANFVQSSRGCHIWIIGNEMNYAVERPGIQIDWLRHASVHGATPEESDPTRHGLAVRFTVLPDHSTEIRTTRGAIVSPGEVITPEMYARCYRLCRDAIHRLPGHEDDQVLVGAVTPWNTQTIYPGNANGDWIEYFRDILEELGPQNCDGFTVHACTHGYDPALIVSDEKLPPPFQNVHLEFQVYSDFLKAVPENMRDLPVYITEADQGRPWQDRNTGWVQRAYKDIDTWNKEPGNQRIRALILYRWPKLDRWHIEDKQGVIEDFQQTLQNDYRWKESPAVPIQSAASTTQPPRVGENGGGSETHLYRVQWTEDRFPAQLISAHIISVPVTIKNIGSLAWNWGGGNPFRVGYRYYRNRRLLSLGADKDIRTDIPTDVAEGASVTVDVRIALPDHPGNYTLELDLVHEGVTWFKEQGSPVLTRWITVEAQREQPPVDGDGASSTLPVPLFADVSYALPKAGTPYARRNLNQIRYVVISHTGANPGLSLERIAETHIRYGYPGIVYHYVVDSGGQVFRVGNMEDVAQPNQPWSEQGVNVCLTGNFNVGAPTLPQLDATGRLCAWLAQNLGLQPDSIMGLGELTRTSSPGDTFYRGPSWKLMISRQVRLHLAAYTGAGDSGRVQELTVAIDNLQSRNRDLQNQVQLAQTERKRLDAFTVRMQSEMMELEQRLAVQATEMVGGVRIHNWIEKLPRDAQRYRQRRSQNIHFVVVNHTGVAPDVSLDEIAAAHRMEWPGILYDYLVDDKGEVYQTQPLDEVVETDEEYLANAINIAFAGNFDEKIPNRDQLYAGGKLIAWLLERYPHLRTESIKGVCEFVDHPSPGEQWLRGQVWRETLLAAVRRTRGLVEPSDIENQLRRRVAEVERQLRDANQQIQGLQDQKIRMHADNQRLQSQLAERPHDNKVYVVPQPAVRVLVDQLPVHPTLRYEHRGLSQISHIAIHHTATPPTMGPARIAELHVAPDSSRNKEAWAGIGYHYFIHADGNVDQTNYLETASYHVYRHNLYSVGIVFAGSFMNGRIPTSAQLRSGAHLVAWLMQDLNVPLARVWGHREFPDNSTVCPGSEWTLGNRWRDLLFERIEQVQAGVGVKSIRHYMLFWQRGFPGPLARQDYVNSINYVVRFRPAVGFSVQDARNAEYVTIVGGEAGISAAEEKTLRASGCKVERIAGRDEEETSRMLSELANQSRRFRTFDVDF